MRKRIAILSSIMFGLIASTAGAAVAPTWNSGYLNWWPAGFGYPPASANAHNYKCSATAFGPTFHSRSSGWTQDYGAGTSCIDGLGTKSLSVSLQVLGQDGHTWYTISGSSFTAGPTTRNPLRARRTRAAYLGHLYRTVLSATLVVPNGYAGCSFTNSCQQTLMINLVSRSLAP